MLALCKDWAEVIHLLESQTLEVDQFEAYTYDWFESLEEVPAQIELDNIWTRVSDIDTRR